MSYSFAPPNYSVRENFGGIELIDSSDTPVSTPTKGCCPWTSVNLYGPQTATTKGIIAAHWNAADARGRIIGRREYEHIENLSYGIY